MIIINRYFNLFSLKDKWLKIQENSYITPFQDYFFVRNLWLNYYPYCFSQKCVPVFFVLEDGGEIKMIAPLCKTKTGFRIFGSVNGCEYCDFIFERGIDIENYLSIFLSYLKCSIGFDMVREDSYLYRYFVKQNNIQNDISITNVDIIIPDLYNSYYMSLSSSSRQNLRTAYNRINRGNHIVRLVGLVGRELVYECVLDDIELGVEKEYLLRKISKRERNIFFKEMIDLYVKRHKEHYSVNTSYLKYLYLRTINYSTVNLKTLNNACSFMVFIDNELAAFMSGYIDNLRGSFVIPRLSINSLFKFYSPGIVLINEGIVFCRKFLSITNLDLGRGGEQYKYVMGGRTHLTHSFSVPNTLIEKEVV